MLKLSATLALIFCLGCPAYSLAEAEKPADTVPAVKSPKSVPPPAPNPQAVEKDTDTATAEIEQHARDEELIRKSVRTPDRRPDLDHDVIQGIQSRNAEEAIRNHR